LNKEISYFQSKPDNITVILGIIRDTIVDLKKKLNNLFTKKLMNSSFSTFQEDILVGMSKYKNFALAEGNNSNLKMIASSK